MNDLDRSPPDIIETMNVARAIADSSVRPSDEQLRALAYRALSLDLQVEKDQEQLTALRDALGMIGSHIFDFTSGQTNAQTALDRIEHEVLKAGGRIKLLEVLPK